MLKESLLEIGRNFYTEKQLSIASDLFDEVQSLHLDDTSKVIAFLMNSDIKNEKVRKQIIEKYGQQIAQNIEFLSRIANISLDLRSKDSANYRKAFIELTDDIKIIIIKLAERLVNLRIADKANDSGVTQFSEKCLYFYSPIAQMLGIRKIYNEMEDIAFKNLFPKDFEFLRKKIGKKEEIYNSKLVTMRNELLKILTEHDIEARIQYRIKRPYSVYRKIKNQKITLEEIYDLLALRVITNNTENCYLSLGIVHNKWLPIEGRFRDWITYPKPNGYRSIQTTVHTRKGDKFEIQIRTEEMHEEAEFGSSAHWAYKQKTNTGNNTWLQTLKEFLENDEYFENPYQFFENLKSEMKRDYINVLTPKGEIISLPEGATPLDFAFSVHTDLGYRTTGAKVNGKFVKLKTELKSGDVVDIISNPSAQPSRDWFGIVKTSRSRSKILRWFKKNERELYIMDGKNSYEKLKTLYKRKIQNFEDEQKVKANILKLGFKNFEDFYFAIASGGVKCSLYLLKKIYPDAFKAVDKERRINTSRMASKLPQVKVEGLEKLDSHFAKCCNPIKGEPIVAYITKKSVLKIHSKSCSLLKTGTIDPENLKPAEWFGGESWQAVKCKLFGVNYSRMLSLVVSAAESESISILSTQKVIVKGKQDCLLFEIELNDKSQFERFKSRVAAENNTLIYQ